MASRRTGVVLAWLLFAATSAARADTGSIKGFITDSTGARLPGVTVTATSVALMGKRLALSDEQGYYRLLDLPPGGYRLEAHLAAFSSVERSDLMVQSGLHVQFDFTMRIGDLFETAEVLQEAPLLETETAMRTLHLDAEFIRAVPLGIGHNWWEALKLVPGVVLREGEADLVESHGAVVSSNAFLLDEIDVGDAQTNTSAMAQLPPDSLAELRITTSGHDAASRMGPGAQIGVVTRSGGNQTQGAVAIDLQFKRLNATNVADGTSADRVIARPEVSLGGPLARDRFWYFAAYQHIRERYGLPRTAEDIELLRLFDDGFVPYDVPFRQHVSFAKATYQPTASDQVVLNVQFDHGVTHSQRSPRFTRERAGSSRWDGFVSSVAWRRPTGDRGSLEARGGFYSKRFDSALPLGQAPNIRIYSNVISLFGSPFGSGSPVVEMGSPPSNPRQLQQRGNVNALFTYFPGEWNGSHELAAGMDLLPWNRFSFQFTAPNDGFAIEEHVLLDPAHPAAGARTFHRRHVSPATLSGDRRSSQTTGFFVQDRWRPGQRWVVNAGVRFEKAETFDNWGKPIQNSWQAGPRLAVTYRPTGDGRIVLRGAFNRMFDPVANRMTPSERSLIQGYRDEYDVDGDGSFETVVTTPAVLERPVPLPNTNRGFASSRLEQPRTDEISVGLSHQLPSKITADVMFIDRVYTGRVVTTDINGIYEDGRFLGYRDPTFNEVFEIRNGTDNWLVYRALELSLQRGFSRDFQFLATYAYARQSIEGTWDRNDPASFLQPDAFPNHKGIGASLGYRQGQIKSLAIRQTNFDLLGSGVPPHTFKVAAAYLAPLGLTVGVTHLFQMGQYSGPVMTIIPPSSIPHPRNVTLSNGRMVVNPLATNIRFFYSTRDEGQVQLPSISELNLRVTKRLRRGSHTLEAGLEIFNLFNQANPRAFELPILTEGQPALFGLTYTQAPRAGLVTARWTF